MKAKAQMGLRLSHSVVRLMALTPLSRMSPAAMFRSVAMVSTVIGNSDWAEADLRAGGHEHFGLMDTSYPDG